MFTINDRDLPITVAEKIINGTKPSNKSEFMKSLEKVIVGENEYSDTIDMFDINEIKEIADYLMVYYNSNND